jgi:hypothetical protein
MGEPSAEVGGVHTQSWEPTRWQHMMLAATQARERGDKTQAERFCIEAQWYIDVNTIESLDDYASLLTRLNRENVGTARVRASQLRQAKAKMGQSERVALGWNLSDELTADAALLRETGREADAAAIQTLVDAHQQAHVCGDPVK